MISLIAVALLQASASGIECGVEPKTMRLAPVRCAK
jgi:hypothetical protein